MSITDDASIYPDGSSDVVQATGHVFVEEDGGAVEDSPLITTVKDLLIMRSKKEDNGLDRHKCLESPEKYWYFYMRGGSKKGFKEVGFNDFIDINPKDSNGTLYVYGKHEMVRNGGYDATVTVGIPQFQYRGWYVEVNTPSYANYSEIVASVAGQIGVRPEQIVDLLDDNREPIFSQKRKDSSTRKIYNEYMDEFPIYHIIVTPDCKDMIIKKNVEMIVANINFNEIVPTLKKMDQVAPVNDAMIPNESVHKFFNQLSKAILNVHSAWSP